ncbi:hypothetical protein [Metabacillus endolithicus]|uniref:MFS transporter n=1 Tax=Metabacillus endolithicus TaxID=1535204 RepID=A0ABW5BUF9_9BACI|nr:hypothetical protein [Metabacillus endolithicus]UPG64704.1 hypothetical protein MVE64_06490 [Metabacillus endolithicus]
MKVYLMLVIGFILLVPILFFIPFGLHKTGKMVLAGVALLCAALFSFTIQLMPIWQAVPAILVLLVAVGYLLNKREALFQLEHGENTDEFSHDELFVSREEKVDLQEESDESLSKSITEEEIEVTPSDSELEPNDVILEFEPQTSENESEQDFLEEFFDQLDASQNDEQPESKTLEEVAISKENDEQEAPSKDKVETDLGDDFLLELFEGRDVVDLKNDEFDEISGIQNEIEENGDEHQDSEPYSEMNDLFETLMNDEERGSASEMEEDEERLYTEDQDMFEVTEGSEKQKSVAQHNVEEESEIADIFEQDHLLEEETNVQQLPPEVEEPKNHHQLSNNVLNMLLEQLHYYKNNLSNLEYENVLQKAVSEASTEKDYYLFAKELLQHYFEKNKETEYHVLLEDMKQKLNQYPVLLEQLTWISSLNK